MSYLPIASLLAGSILCSIAALAAPGAEFATPGEGIVGTYRKSVPEQRFETVKSRDEKDKPRVMQRQRVLLDERYDLADRPSKVRMSGGRKFVQEGVRVNLARDMTWEKLSRMSPEQIRATDAFPKGFLPLPHVKHETGGQVFPQEEFNATDDRKVAEPQFGVACLDCHSNFHTNGAFHLNPDTRPQDRRFRLDTTSLRGLFSQQIHGSKRSLRSVEDFTEFEQRTAYFNGDHISADKKGTHQPNRTSQVALMAQMQNIIDFPPAPKLDVFGKLDPEKATEQELMGERVFYGKGRCAECHVPPAFMDQQMHDLKAERFYKPELINGQTNAADGPIKTFTLRAIKDSPPYMHDGRMMTLEDTVEYFNLVLSLRLGEQDKAALVAYMRQL